MNLSVTRLALDVRAFETQLTFSVKQGDTARRLEISLVDHAKPYDISEGCYATFTARRSDDEFASDSCVVADNKITYDLSPRFTAAAGIVQCEITLFNADGERLTSPHFSMAVYSSVATEFADDAMESDSFAILTSAIMEANSAVERAENAVTTAEGMFASLEQAMSRASQAADAAEQAADTAEQAAETAEEAALAQPLPATSERIGGVRIGENITNNGGAISITSENVTNALGYTPPRKDTTYPIASSTADGLLSTSLYQSIASLLGSAKTVFGTYNGNGAVSSTANPVSVTFTIVPRAVFIFGSSDSGSNRNALFGAMISGQINGAGISVRLYDVANSANSITMQDGNNGAFLPNVTFSGKTVSWGKMTRSDVSAAAIFNANGKKYSYIAIG